MYKQNQKQSEIALLYSVSKPRFGILAIELIGNFEPWGQAPKGHVHSAFLILQLDCCSILCLPRNSVRTYLSKKLLNRMA